MVCVGATEPGHPKSVLPLLMKPEHLDNHRLDQYSESGDASHTSIQQSGASSGLDHATGSATTDNPQDRSPRSNHWLDAATSTRFRSPEREIYSHACVKITKYDQQHGYKSKRLRIKSRNRQTFLASPTWLRPLLSVLPGLICSCFACLPACFAAQQ